MGPITIGVDVGQKADPTAVAVDEMQWRAEGGKRVDCHIIRHLERLPLGTKYPVVAQRLAAIHAGVRQMSLQSRTQAAATVYDPAITAYRRVAGQQTLTPIRIYVDATGVGQPVVDLLTQTGMRLCPCYFTYGDRRIKQHDGTVTIGKAWLVSRLQALLQSGRILLPKTDESAALAKELLDYEIKVDQEANDKYGAFRVGAHDDLVTALGLAVQDVARVPGAPVAGGTRVVLRPAPLPRHCNALPPR
jgi:hypothetical protein